MTCCIGKARIYFKEPLGYGLRYKLGGSWKTILKQEKLTYTCKTDLSRDSLYKGTNYREKFKIGRDSEEIDRFVTGFQGGSALYFLGPVKICVAVEPDGLVTSWGARNWRYAIYSGEDAKTKTCNFNEQGMTPAGSYYSFSRTIDFELVNEKFYDFEIKGESGTIYVSLKGLTECPEVDNLGCLMGEERYIDQLLPDQSPGGPVKSSCFTQIVDGDNWIVSLTTTYNNIDNKALRPPESRIVLYLTGLPGCPPEYRVECCGIDQCEPEEKCPPDTDCSLDCGGLVCCYKDGKVIKSFRK